jgi:hypothetical protein
VPDRLLHHSTVVSIQGAGCRRLRLLLVVFIIFLPKGILGSILEKVKTQRQRQARRIND